MGTSIRLLLASALYHRLLIWLCRNMNTNTFQELTIRKDVENEAYQL
jgi:hypothetical protein